MAVSSRGRDLFFIPYPRIVTIPLNASGTRLIFDQTGIAEHDVGHLSEGWPIHYWEPLRKYLDGK
jgi:hypothetical protein